MNRLLLGCGVAVGVFLVGCTTPVRIKSTGVDGVVQELEIRDSSGKVIEVSNSSKEKIEKIVPAIEKEISSVLTAKVAEKDFRVKYEIDCGGAVGSVHTEPLTEEENAAIRNVIVCLIAKHTDEIVYQAWAKELSKPVLAAAQEKLALSDYAGAREAIWSYTSSGVDAVDARVKCILTEFLNSKVNPAQWAVVEKELKERFSGLLQEKKYNEARKFAKEYPAIRTYSVKLSEPPASSASDNVDSPTELGTVAFNSRLTALKGKLLEELASARQAELDAKMQAKADDLVAKVITAVRAKKFPEARMMIRDFDLVSDSQWNTKLYIVRIGLLNTVVNPHQLDFEKVAIASKVNELVKKGDKDGAIKYLKNYSYVHDTFAQIMSAVSNVKTAMKGLEIEDSVSGEYEAELRQRIQQIIEKRLGDKVGEGPKATEELEKALSDLEKGYVAQHFDETLAAQIRDTVRKEVLALADFRRDPMTTWELNEALRAYVAALRESLRDVHKGAPTATAGAVPVLDYDVQIAMAEAAICSPAPLYGLEAVLGDYARIVRRAKKGEPVSKEEATALLVGSVFLNQPKAFKQAVKLGADVNAAPRRDGLVRPAILVAVQSGRYEFVDEVVTLKGDMKVVDVNGDTVLHYAVERGNLPLVNKAVSAVDPKSVNKSGETALFTAVRRNQLQVAKFLLAMFSDEKSRREYVEIKNSAGLTALDLACTVNAHMLLDTLAQAGAKFDEKDLALAADNNCVGAAQWLVEQGLDVNDSKVLSAIKKDGKDRKPNAAIKYLQAEGLKLPAAGREADPVQDPTEKAE